jgi:transcriptional regulator with XRE-family HTH domain
MMKPEQLKKLRKSFGFTQKQMADVLGIHPNALQKMEYGTGRIPKYIRNYAWSLATLNETRFFKRHLMIIGVKS